MHFRLSSTNNDSYIYIYSYIYSYIYDYIMSSSNTSSIVAFDSPPGASYQTPGSSTRYRSSVQTSTYVDLPQPIDFLVKNEPDMSFQDPVLVGSHGFIFPNVDGAEESFQSFIFEDISNVDAIDIDNLFDFWFDASQATNTTGTGESIATARTTSRKRTTVKALRHFDHMTLRHIVKVTDLPLTTVINIVNEPETPRRGRDRPRLIDTPIRMRIIDCVIASAEGRQMTYSEVGQHLGLNMAGDTIRRTLNEYRYHRRLAIAKLFLTEDNMRNRLAFAQKYADYDTLDWARVIFTDESAVQNEGTNRRFVTRQPDEQYHKHCLRPKFRKPSYCMIWGAICEQFKSSLIIWDRKNGTTNSKTFVEHILPVRKLCLKLHQNHC